MPCDYMRAQHARQRKQPVHGLSRASLECACSGEGEGASEIMGCRAGHKVPCGLLGVGTLETEESRKVSFSTIL